MVLLGKIMILQGLDIQYHALGYATRMTPKKGGIRRPRLRLILQPLFEVIPLGIEMLQIQHMHLALLGALEGGTP